MIVYLIRRLVQSIATLWAVGTIVFFAVFAVGNPVDALVHPAADQAEIDRVTREFGLDRPIWEQYGAFVVRTVQGDFGESFIFNRPAFDLILERLPATLELVAVAMMLAVIVGVPLGFVAGMRPDSRVSKGIMAGSVLAFSLPGFWVGLILIYVFSVYFGVLPPAGQGDKGALLGITTSLATLDGLKHVAMPAFNLSLVRMGLITRLVEAGYRENVQLDYVRFARAKGLPRSRIVGVHIFKNMLPPIATVLGIEIGGTIAFAVVTETVFVWPGIGQLFVQAVGVGDRPLIVAYIILVAVMFILINLVVDVVNSLLDPRVVLDGSTR